MNLIARTLTGIVIVAIIAASILCGYGWCIAFFCFLTLAMTRELISIINKSKGIAISKWSVLPAALLFLSVPAAYAFVCCQPEASLIDCGFQYNGRAIAFLVLAGFLLSLVALMVYELFRKAASPVTHLSGSLMPLPYIAIPLALIPVLGLWCGSKTGVPYNGLMPMALFIFIWCNDVGAYCVGCTLGRHRLFPRVSPKKSWEGSIGGASITIAAAIIMALTMPHHFGFLPVWVWAVTAVITVIAGTFGDLVESLIKRELGIKDSGNILPGHGGFLDRFDSTLMAVPAVTAFLLLYGILC